MPVITFAQVKGGAGKTTSICALAPAFRTAGLTVTVIDADPQQSAFRWFSRYSAHVGAAGSLLADGVSMRPQVDESSIIDQIDAATAESDIVLVDLQGSANQAMLYAVGRSNLVVVPCQPGEFDVAEALRTLATVVNAGKMTRRDIPARVLMTRTSPSLKRKADAHGRAQLVKAGAQVLDTELLERTYFAQVTYTGAPPDPTDPAETNVAGNIAALLREIVKILKAGAAA